MNEYRFSVGQAGEIQDEQGNRGPEHFTAVRVIKNAGGTGFAEAKAGVLATLRNQEQQMRAHPEELRRTRRLIDKVQGLDEGTADLYPNGEKWL